MGERARFCSNCGQPVEPGAMFCAHCGHKTEVDEAPAVHETPVANEASSVNEAQATGEIPSVNEEFATEWPDEQEERVQKNEPKGSKNLVIILGIVCAVMAVVIIALVVFGLGRSKKETKPETKTETTEQKEPEKKEIKDSNEPNDSIDQAITLEEGKPVTGYIDSKDDVDYFVISTQKEGTAEVKFSYTPSNDQGGLGWKVNYPDKGTTKTELCMLGEGTKTLKFELQKGDNYISVTGDTEASKKIEDVVTETPYYITAESIKVKQDAKKKTNNNANNSSNASKIIVINPYDNQRHYISSSGYVIPYSSDYLLDYSDISGLSSAELRLARNEIFAREGRLFDDQSLQAYFDSQAWYNGYIAPKDFKDSYLSPIEKKNVDFIKKYE